RPHDVPLRLDRGERAEGESRTVGARDPRKLEGASVAGGERLCDGERPVPELRLRSDELDVDALLGNRPKRQHRLEAGDATAHDQHAQAIWWLRCVTAHRFLP